MSEPTILIHIHSMPEIPRVPTVIGVCCREWPLALGFSIGPCGLCGERPVVEYRPQVTS